MDHDSRRVQRAVEYVEDRWFPVNQDLLKRIRKGFEDGRYELDIDFLIDDLKGDLSLFAFCMRELAAAYYCESSSEISYSNPIELFRWAGARRLQTILCVDRQDISTHKFDSLHNFQRDRLTETLVSASTVEVLSGDTSVPPEFGFSSSVLRNLGLLLITWNYPTIYAQALSNLTKETNLDELISEALGFSPMLLAISLFKRWGLPEWWILPASKSSSMVDRETQAVLCILEKLHNVGEALARANNPATYPTAAEDWASAKKGIVETLGQGGLSRIRQTVEQRCEYYRKALPDIFKDPVEVDAEQRITQLAQKQLHDRNPFIRRCSLEIRNKLEQVYKMLGSQAIASEPIRILTKQVIPYCGFTGCMVYVYDPGLMSLVPRMHTGQLRIRKPISIPYSPEGAEHDFISLAFECKTPLVENSRSSEDDILFMAACLGQKQKAGVLYLEMPQGVAAQLNSDVLTLFKAIAQTLMDCLHLQ